MPNEIELNQKEQSLIAIGASVGAGCQPCTAYHVKAACAAGACDRSIALAVETALTGRTSATIGMSEWAARRQGAKPEIDTEFRSQKVLIAELTSIATAVAVNSVPDLQKHLDAARDAGAWVEQIRVAIEIARKIKRVAEEKVGAITDRIEKDAQATTTGGPGCCGSNEEERPVVAAGARTDCGCGKAPENRRALHVRRLIAGGQRRRRWWRRRRARAGRRRHRTRHRTAADGAAESSAGRRKSGACRSPAVMPDFRRKFAYHARAPVGVHY